MTDKKEAVEAVRPLNGAQTKNLKEIVAGDYAKIRSELRAHTIKRLQDAETELLASASVERQNEFVTRAARLIRQLNQEMQDLCKEAGLEGISIAWTPITEQRGSSNRAVQDAITREKARINKESQLALETLNQQELDSMRIILLASISGLAEDVLSTIPTPQQLLDDARQRRLELEVPRASGS